jgi:hypothetical protein
VVPTGARNTDHPIIGNAKRYFSRAAASLMIDSSM